MKVRRYRLIHKDTKQEIFLAQQQSQCFMQVMQGKSAKKIASDMNLSHRTVQHYLSHVRRILGCASTKEVIVAYYNQINCSSQ